MKVFGIYEKIDGLDMIDSFNEFFECGSIEEAVESFMKKLGQNTVFMILKILKLLKSAKRLQKHFKKNRAFLKTILDCLGNTTYYLIHGQNCI